jgi:spore maturation protein CgeB
LASFDVDAAVDGADVVLVHEWNDPELARSVGDARRRADFRLLFHDTHHRAATAPHEIEGFDLTAYDGVLAFGRVIADLYEARGWRDRVWTWHEAADTRLFRPLAAPIERDLVWIGNWGDGERADELREFLVEPVRELGLSATAYGVRYPEPVLRELRAAGFEYGGWLPNHRVPDAYARHRVTVHVPRRPYVEALPGIPTIRPFEALACGIPLVSAPWEDVEGLFRGGDFRRARDGAEMARELLAALEDERGRGLETIRERHTCAHRVDELLAIIGAVGDAKAAA